MTRATSLTYRLLLPFVLVAISAAGAMAKPTVAVLGLEVLDKGGGGIDQATTNFAHELTIALRDRATAGGPYTLQVNADKELVDEKLIKGCDSENPTCMAPIGGDLGAAYLIYGSVEKKKDGTGYTVKIMILNVANKTRDKTWLPPTLSAADAKDPGSQGFKEFARKGYNYLTGSNASPLKISVTNKDVDRGLVLIDGEERGPLISGSASIAGVPEGKHKIAIEVGGFQRYEGTVTVSPDEPVSITLIPLPDEHRDNRGADFHHKIENTTSDNGGSWGTIAVVSGIAAVGLGVGFGYSWYELSQTGKNTNSYSYGSKCTFTDGSMSMLAPGTTNPSQCNHYNTYLYGSYVTGATTIASLGILAFSLYKTYSHTERPPAGGQVTNRNRKKRPEVVVTPVISPNGGGATVQFDW